MRFYIISLLLVTLSSCSLMRDTLSPTEDPSPHYKVGNPYKIAGIWYYPQVDYGYDEVGIASWYGDKFHNKRTANGEIFDMNALTAAHKTLPLPSMVEVTNLENGRKVVLRVNDRGPFVGTRIIDLSRRASQLLGFQKKGIAKVRVRILTEESMSMAAKLSDDMAPIAATKAPTEDLNEMPLAEIPSESVATAPPTTMPTSIMPASTESASTMPTESSPAEAPQIIAGNEVLVQVGAFGSEANAQKMLTELKSKGFTRAKLTKDTNDALVRVRIGPLADTEEAKVVISRAINSGFADSRVVVITP